MCVKENATEPTTWRRVGQTSAPSSTSGLEDRRTSTPNPTSDCLHPAAHKLWPAAGSTTSLLTAHTASAQLKLRFSKQDAAAWEERSPDLVYRAVLHKHGAQYAVNMASWHTLATTGTCDYELKHLGCRSGSQEETAPRKSFVEQLS